ncbi:class I SAM-dependent methyltransferase [Gordonia sp. CPCC 205515]|uniref:class I SAM-dependent methyltransferase n=1 Tax=Gordonia sp. CPCC 205515 TaxID=3140791 RepID=UPI003AF401D3
MVNESMQETWADAGVGWVANEATFDRVFTPFTQALMDRADIAAGSNVLDIGCGSGTLLKQAEGRGATVTGVDISEAMVEAARKRVPEATVTLADAQTATLQDGSAPPFDHIISRFGVMFFDDPVAAFTNIRRFVAPGGRLTFVCWRAGGTTMFTLGTSVLTDRLSAVGATSDASAPGPLAFGDDGRITQILSDSGWTDISIEPLDGECDYSTETSDGVEERLSTVFATSTGRNARVALYPELGEDGWAALVDEVRADVRRHRVDGKVTFVGETWLVTASSPSV